MYPVCPQVHQPSCPAPVLTHADTGGTGLATLNGDPLITVISGSVTNGISKTDVLGVPLRQTSSGYL